jgi:hypothetical protein
MPNRPWLYSNVELNFRKQDIFGQKENQLKLAYIFQYVHWFLPDLGRLRNTRI